MYAIGSNDWLGDPSSPGTPHGRITLSPPACVPADGSAHAVGFTYLPEHDFEVYLVRPTDTWLFDMGHSGSASGAGAFDLTFTSSQPSGAWGIEASGNEFPSDRTTATIYVYHPGIDHCP